MLIFSGVIHCDLKPENILVFDGGSGPIAKISDFGSSIIVDQENSLYELPVSEPWTAPEHHHRGVFAAQAYGMDLYRLVLICLWLLLDCIGDRNTVGPTALFRAMKQSGRLRDAAMEYMRSSILDPAIMTRLSDIFQASLAENPAERHFTLADVIRSLTLHGYPNLILEQDCADSSRELANPPHIVPVSHSRYHVDFNVGTSLVHREVIR
jgi:serine/threonine protein kinase